MKKLYGFKESDAIGLIEFMKENSNKSLTEIFELYAKKSKKAKGTVRNLYYTIARLADEDLEFREKYLSGERLSVEKKVEFAPSSTEWLIRSILTKKAEGKSVRRAVEELAEGNSRLALRYQNKYRSILRKEPKKIMDIAREFERENPKLKPLIKEKRDKNEFLIERLKGEINKLFERSFLELKRENQMLKSLLKIQAEEIKAKEKEKSDSKIEDFFKVKAKKNDCR